MGNTPGGYFDPPHDRNDLAYWFPKLLTVGMRVPRTEILRTDVRLDLLLDGETPAGHAEFIGHLDDAARRVGGYPCFLRTGHTSGKHEWKHTCYVSSPGALPSHVVKLVEFSALVDMLGLPTNTWVVRELLPTRALCTLPMYGDMPVVREVRAFIRDGEVICIHPYWPRDALAQGYPYKLGADEPDLPADFDRIVSEVQRLGLSEEADVVRPLLERVASAFKGDGAWSVDVLLDVGPDHRAYVTDMAEAGRSYHFEGCPHAQEFERG